MAQPQLILVQAFTDSLEIVVVQQVSLIGLMTELPQRLATVTAVSTPGNDSTPSFVFSSDEAGTITSDMSEGFSTSTSASSGNNTITFNSLDDGTYSGKTITVTDAVGNANSLTIPDFVIETVAPTMTISSATVSSGETSNDDSISLTFTSNEATTNFVVGDVTVSGGSLSNFAASSTSVYTATFTPSSAGATSIDVGAGVIYRCGRKREHRRKSVHLDI